MGLSGPLGPAGSKDAQCLEEVFPSIIFFPFVTIYTTCAKLLSFPNADANGISREWMFLSHVHVTLPNQRELNETEKHALPVSDYGEVNPIVPQ